MYLEKIIDDDKWQKLHFVRSIPYYVKSNSVSIFFTPFSNILEKPIPYTSDYWENNPQHAYNAYKKYPSIIFVGIALPGIELDSLCSDNQFEYSSLYNETKKDLTYLSEEEFIQKYYYDVILFERVLEKTNSNLKLYHTETGLPILSSKEALKIVSKLKKKCM